MTRHVRTTPRSHRNALMQTQAASAVMSLHRSCIKVLVTGGKLQKGVACFEMSSDLLDKLEKLYTKY